MNVALLKSKVFKHNRAFMGIIINDVGFAVKSDRLNQEPHPVGTEARAEIRHAGCLQECVT